MFSLRTYAAAALPLALAATAVTAARALAQEARHGGGARVSAAGHCSAGSTWKLKAKHDNNRLDVEFEVDTNVVGQAWAWQLADNGATVARGSARTTAPSGSFTVHRLIADRPGVDAVSFRATRVTGGQTCTGSVRL